ncbi:MAG TPA: hypothetical protein VIM63_04660, partial [Rhodoferax sp.]
MSFFLLSDAPIPAPLRPWVRHCLGVRLSAASVPVELNTWLDEAAESHCWLVDGSVPGQWLTCVRTLRDAGWLEELPWALWLPESRARAENESIAWEQGAVEVFDADQGAVLAHCIESLMQ